jgi:hypothetical protein
MKPACVALVMCAAALVAGPAWAHHSHAMYDPTAEIELEGAVKELRWSNPHVWLYVTVRQQDGTEKIWALEGGSTGQLERKGWAREMFKPGAPIKISCYPLRSGGPGCLGGYILALDGATMPATHERHIGREFD